jgi:hypothetical protein
MPRRSATSRPADTSGASSSSAPWTPERIRDLGAVCSLPTAAQILQISVSLAYQLADRGAFPVPVIKSGPDTASRYRHFSRHSACPPEHRAPIRPPT